MTWTVQGLTLGIGPLGQGSRKRKGLKTGGGSKGPAGSNSDVIAAL